MALGLRRKSSGKPQTQQAPAQSAPPAPGPAPIPSDWREQLTATKPKGRFQYGENIPGNRRK
jgi:hypothetical protein